NECITGLQNKDLVSNSDFQFSGEDVVNLILARMRMTRHTHPRCEAHFQQAVLSSRIDARQAYGTDSHVEVITIDSRLIFHRRSVPICVTVERPTQTGVGQSRCACESVCCVCVHMSLSISVFVFQWTCHPSTK